MDGETPSAGHGPFLIGIDGGTEGLRAGVFNAAGRALAFAATPYGLAHPRPGWAEQDPGEWWSALVSSVRGAVEKAGVRADEVAGLSADGTTCTVVALDEQDRQLRPAIIWMDVRASVQARAIGGSSHPARWPRVPRRSSACCPGLRSPRAARTRSWRRSASAWCGRARWR